MCHVSVSDHCGSQSARVRLETLSLWLPDIFTIDCVFMTFYFFAWGFSHGKFKRMSFSVMNISSADEFDV